MAPGWTVYPDTENEIGQLDWASSPATPDDLDDPTPKRKRIRLGSGAEIRRELAKVYKGIKAGEINVTVGSKLVYTLSIMSQILERDQLAELERRADAIEGK